MGLAGMRFLVAEDHAFQRRNLVRILERLGAAEVIEAADGNSAFAAFTGGGQPFDIIVCDLDMPGMNGMELMWRISKTGVPAAVILTSRLGLGLVASVGETTRGYGINVLGVMEKPATAEKLLGLIAPHEKSLARAAKRLRGAKPRKTSVNPIGEISPARAAKPVAAVAPCEIPAVAEDAPVNWRVFRELWTFDPAAEKKLLRDLCASNTVDMQALRASVEHQERAVIARAAHRIGGASRSVGALPLADACAELEFASAQMDWQGIGRLFARVETEVDRLKAYIESV